jgi:hypothetical protein
MSEAASWLNNGCSIQLENRTNRRVRQVFHLLFELRFTLFLTSKTDVDKARDITMTRDGRAVLIGDKEKVLATCHICRRL